MTGYVIPTWHLNRQLIVMSLRFTHRARGGNLKKSQRWSHKTTPPAATVSSSWYLPCRTWNDHFRSNPKSASPFESFDQPLVRERLVVWTFCLADTSTRTSRAMLVFHCEAVSNSAPLSNVVKSVSYDGIVLRRGQWEIRESWDERIGRVRERKSWERLLFSIFSYRFLGNSTHYFRSWKTFMIN